MKICGKRGGGWLSFFVNHILSMLLIILSILFLGVLMKSALLSSTPNSDVDDLRYNLRSARLLNSADCLAYEQPYLDANSNVINRVRAGTIDLDKFKDSRKWSKCIGGTHAWLTLTDSTSPKFGSDDTSDWRWDSENLPVNYNFDKLNHRDFYLVKIYRNDLREFHDGYLGIKFEIEI
ncbi:MAG: hypothetical protein HY438_02780 [DPANN group archaeon]|nr:hypothetical protein [DPANN group archaeon]